MERNYIRKCPKGTESKGVDSIHVAVAKDQWCGEVNTVPSLRFSEANITFSKAA